MTSSTPSLPLFAQRMKAARELLGISQMELGVRAGIEECSASARINQYERGKHAPDFLTAQHLAGVLQVPTAYFYAEDGQLAELVVLFHKMQCEQRIALLDTARLWVKQA
jgi:transcriptional regulator with XRE-family HTH domain